MNTEIKKRSRLAGTYAVSPAAHIVCLVSLAVIALHLILRGNKALMVSLSNNLIRPIHRALSVACSRVPFSVAELLIGLAVITVLVYIIFSIIRLFRREGVRAVYRLFVVIAAFVLGVYALFCVMWGTYYYGDDFMSVSGLKSDPVSLEQLETVTAYFAELANKYSAEVQRNADGTYYCDRDEILAQSSEVYAEIEHEYPCLAGPDIDAKGIRFSRIMSYTDFTGFFFPFTSEANVNTDFPPSQFAATVAHELSHQRGVAKEQEANFVAVLASLEYGDADYCYSASLLAYTHLGNALYKADREAWSRIYETLDGNILLDFAADREYWAQFETPVQTVSNTVYEGFLESYGQTLGLKSYGACVDLLVNYFYPLAN